MRQDLDDCQTALDGILRVLRSDDTIKLRQIQDLARRNASTGEIVMVIEHLFPGEIDGPSKRVSIDALISEPDDQSTSSTGRGSIEEHSGHG